MLGVVDSMKAEMNDGTGGKSQSRVQGANAWARLEEPVTRSQVGEMKIRWDTEIGEGRLQKF